MERDDQELYANEMEIPFEESKPQGTEELDKLRRRLEEMEKEAAVLRQMQSKVENEIGATQDPAKAASTVAGAEEVDSKSIYVGNVDYECTVEKIQHHFQECGTVNRVTILCDKFGQPKGFAFVEFLEEDAVQSALRLSGSELHGRQLRVMPKRKNIPGLKQHHPRRFNPYYYSPYGIYGYPPFHR